ncbi:phosphoserine transaminase [Castellaniella sp. MT123]|uniref:phosphoserine transaminase n=1 Tax=Castellaniella sp. MT123 TaxID=3140381 RepID=UPI0031F43FB9
MNKVTKHDLNKHNFSGGPGVLPETVLEQLKESIVAVPDVGLSILGINHRSDWFAVVVAELEENIQNLLGLPKDYHCLFLQGGATQQFSMVPMTLLKGKTQSAEYLQTGYWSNKVIAEARREGPVHVSWSGQAAGFTRLPKDEEIEFNPGAPYLHYVSNETVEGLQFHRIPGRDDVPRICDMSSDFLSAPRAFDKFSMIYAHAQKNIGPAGVTVVVVKDELLKDAPRDLPAFLDYRAQIDARSILNTPPVFSIYVVLLVTRWLRDSIGGLAAMADLNMKKASALYRAIDASDDFYCGRVVKEDRSTMNVVFNLKTKDLEHQFLASAQEAGFSGLNGHRSIGGIRASLYNGLQLSAVENLIDFMENFKKCHS